MNKEGDQWVNWRVCSVKKTHSEMWTKMSSPPWEGRIKPWPWDLEKFLQTPLKTGPDLALTVLQEGTETQEERRETERHKSSQSADTDETNVDSLFHSRWVRPGAFGGQRTGRFSRLWWFPLPLPDPTALPQEWEGEMQGSARGGERQRGVWGWRGINRVWHLWNVSTSGTAVFCFCFFWFLLRGFVFAGKRRKEGYTSCMTSEEVEDR